MVDCTHIWIGRPDRSESKTQRYKCDGCGAWAYRRFTPTSFGPITPYANGRSFEEPQVYPGGRRGYGPDRDAKRDRTGDAD